MRLFTLFPNLITKESYNWWVTRRFWGFRQQISKAKYLKISRNVGRNYLEASGEHRGIVKKNISKRRSDISGSFRRTPRHCAKWLQNSPGKRYQRIRICLTGESWNALLSHPASGAGCEISGEGGTSAGQNSGCEISGWNVGGAEFWMRDNWVEWQRQQNSGCETSGWNGGDYYSKSAIW